MTRSHIYGAAATIVGTIVGAGILGLPYVVSRTGIAVGIVQLISVGLLFMLLNLYVGEISLRTKGDHQLSGYAEKYLGKKAKIVMILSMMFGIWMALVAYGIGIGAAIAAIVGGSALVYGIIVFLSLAITIYFGINIIENAEKLLVTTMIATILLICLQTAAFIKTENLTTISYAPILSSFSVIFFAYLGSVSVIEAKQILGRKRGLLKKVIIIGAGIPIILYVLFAFFVVGVAGMNTTEVATVGLGMMTSKNIIFIGNILAILTMSTSFISLGFCLKDTFRLDFKLNRNIAWIMTITIPLAIILFQFAGFIKAISIAGALEGGILSTLIVLIALKSKEKSELTPEYSIPLNKFGAGLIIIFFIGIMLYQIAVITGII